MFIFCLLVFCPLCYSLRVWVRYVFKLHRGWTLIDSWSIDQSLGWLDACYSLLHVNVAARFLQAVVGDEIGLHWVVCIAILSVHELSDARRARPVNSGLVQLLHFLSRVTEHFAIFRLLCSLRLWQTLVQHVLIVLDDGSVAAELVIESILCVRQDVSLVAHCGSIRLVSVRHGGLVILAQIGVESTLSVGWSVVCPQTTRAIRYVSVTAAAIVHVDHGLWMNVRQVMLWALLQECESA